MSQAWECTAALAEKVQDLIDTVTSLGRTVLEYEPGNAENVLRSATNLVDYFETLDKMKNDTTGAYVPLDLITWIDEGKNCETFTKELVQRTASENQFLYGKVFALETFRKILEAELQKTYPDEFATCTGVSAPGENTEIKS